MSKDKEIIKALEFTKLIEITLVVAIEGCFEHFEMISAMDVLDVSGEATIIGWTERDLIMVPKPEDVILKAD